MLLNVVEECGEMVQEVGKCGRFTKEHIYNGTSNFDRLRLEFADLLAVMAAAHALSAFDIGVTHTKILASIEDPSMYARYLDKYERTIKSVQTSADLGALTE